MKTQISKIGLCLLAAGTINIGNVSAQNVGISATGVVPHTSAGLDVNFNNKGMLIPRVALTSTTDVTTIPGPAKSLVVYNTNASMTGGNGRGYYFFDSTSSSCCWRYLPAPVNGPGNTGQVLVSQGANNPPQWSTLSVSGGGGATGCANCISQVSNTTWSGITWIQCADNCRNLTEGGYNDWRMPTFDECIMYRTSRFIPAPSGGWINNYVWTSTPWDARVGGTPSNGYWVIFYESDGYWTSYNYGFTNYCRCVR